MTRCPPLCGRKSQKNEKVKRTVTLEEEKIVRWVIDDKEVSQTSFGHISIKSSTIPTVLKPA